MEVAPHIKAGAIKESPTRTPATRRVAGAGPGSGGDRTAACSCWWRSALPPPGDDSYYVFELVGLAVEEEGGRALGSVREVAPGIANDVLELDSGLLLPMHEECIRSIDVKAGTIVVARGFADPP